MKRIKLFLPYLKGSYGLAFLSLFCALISTGSKLAIPLLAGQAINALLEQGTGLPIAVYLNLILIFIVLGTLFRYAFDYLTALLGQRVVKRMRRMVFAAYQDAPISYIDQTVGHR